MPQLELSNFASQIFWLVLTFTVLYLVMARSALPRVREILQERKERITTDIEKAEAIKQQVESVKAEYMAALSSARTQAKKVVLDADEAIKKEIHDRSAKLDETLARQIKEADALLVRTREEALQKLAPVSIEVTQLILEKLLHRKVEASYIQEVVSNIVREQGSLSQMQGGVTKLVRKAS